MTQGIMVQTKGVSLENWQEQLRRGALDLAILLAVAPEPRYGLDLIRRLEKTTDLVVTEGTIYPILGRLTRDGLLTAQWVAETPHPRKYYRLTEWGRSTLAEMLRQWRELARKVDSLARAAAKGGPNEVE